MGPGLHLDVASPVHRAPAEAKIAALVAFVLAVVATPGRTWLPFVGYALIVAAVWQVARIPLRWAAPRMVIEVPFLVLAVLLAFADGGGRVTVAGASLSVDGLWAAWGLVAKGTLGVAASLTVAATTSARELPVALGRLGVPALGTSIVVLALRYIDVIAAEAARMRIARISRGDSPRALHQVAATARGIGVLFLRSFERGERVYLAMLSRGYDGRVPELGASPRAGVRQWLLVSAPAVAAAAVSLTAWAAR